MRGPASPVFTARISDITIDGKEPARSRLHSLLELRLFIPDESPEREKPLPLEYLLRGDAVDWYVHFLIQGIDDDTGPARLHRLCLLLLRVRDNFFDELLSFVQTETGNS